MRALLAALLLAFCGFAFGQAEEVAHPDAKVEQRLKDLGEELRCLVCQNETIASSHADLAVDLREQVRTMLRKGETDEHILRYMTDRYGDFVLYRPPMKASTLLLWWGPGVLLVGGVATLILVLRKRSRLSDDRFEPDEPEASEADTAEQKP
jgi:cytochrome c-type biogenesis protein CcmH